jgi:hypothetical protein
MSNFSPSNLVAAQALLADKFNQAEMRQKALPAVRLALQNSDVLIPTAQVLRTREDRAVSAYILKRSVRATTSSRTYNHSGSRGDSIAVALSWTSFADKFSISLKQMDNNMFGFNQTLAQQIENAILNIQTDIETAEIAYLMAQRSQVNAGTVNGTWNSTTYAYEIDASYKQRFVQIAKAMMVQNKYRGMYDMITDPLTHVDAEFFANQGSSNGTNTGFQFSGVNIAESTDLSDSDYAGGCAFIMPAGSFGMLPWIPKQNREGYGDFNSYTGGFGSIADPTGLPLTYALHGYAARADASGSNGDTQDVVLEFELSVDIANILSPISGSSSESVVFELGQLL